jgi:hypothetical protein
MFCGSLDLTVEHGFSLAWPRECSQSAGGFNPDDASPRSTIHFEHAAGCHFEILQVNQKFSGLRIYVNHAADPIRQCIEATMAGINLRAR